MAILGIKRVVWLAVVLIVCSMAMGFTVTHSRDGHYLTVSITPYNNYLKAGFSYLVSVSSDMPSWSLAYARISSSIYDYVLGNEYPYTPYINFYDGDSGYVPITTVSWATGGPHYIKYIDLGIIKDGVLNQWSSSGNFAGISMYAYDGNVPDPPGPTFTLGVSVPDGGGTVGIVGQGIASSGNPWIEDYEEDTEVELIAYPDEGYCFSHFYHNGEVNTSDVLNLTMNQAHTVEAYFYDESGRATIQLEWVHVGRWGDAASIEWDYTLIDGEVLDYEWVSGDDFTGDWFQLDLPSKVYLTFSIDDPQFIQRISTIRVNGKVASFEKYNNYEAAIGFIFGDAETLQQQEYGLSAVSPSLYNYYGGGGTYKVTIITSDSGGDEPPTNPSKANVMPYGHIRDEANDWLMPDGCLFGYAEFGIDGLVTSRSNANIGYLDWDNKEIAMDLYSGKHYTVRRWDNKINFFTITDSKSVYLGSEMVGAAVVRSLMYQGQKYDGLVSIYDRQFPFRDNKIYFYDIILEVVGPNMLPPGEDDDNFPANPEDYPEDQEYDEELTKWKTFIKDLFVMSQSQWEMLLSEVRSSLEGKFPFGLFYEANMLGNPDTADEGLGFLDLSHWNLGTVNLEDNPITDPVKEFSRNISSFLFWGFFVIWLLSFLQVRLVID